NFHIGIEQTVFQLNTCDSNEKIVEFIRQDSVNIVVSANEIRVSEATDFMVLGKFSPDFKHNEVRLKSFFLKNSITNENRKLTDLKVNNYTNEFQVKLNLKENPLYEGNWEMFCLGTFNDKPISIKVKYTKAKKVVGCYFSNYDQLYNHVFSRNSKHELVMNIKQNTER
ncbi:hypothetical protein P7M79_30800, partial [Vibrio parahaemolyticus]|nr:hypothetical protein [Vibrio parahaemolyticus]